MQPFKACLHIQEDKSKMKINYVYRVKDFTTKGLFKGSKLVTEGLKTQKRNLIQYKKSFRVGDMGGQKIVTMNIL